MFVEPDDRIEKLGKFPDYLVKGLNKPSVVGSKIRGIYQLGKILYKTGAYKKVGRYYGFRYRYKIGTAIATVAISSSFLQFPSENRQTRSNMVQFKSKRRIRSKYCPPRRRPNGR